MARRILTIIAFAFVLMAWLPAVSARTHSTTVEFFSVGLEPYGRWVDHPIYGTVWVPANHEPDWTPYSRGRWVWTTDYGWYWDSDEEFGWATYHYGRWVLTADLGWVWVPDNVWGPAWVDWRYDDGYVGWAPMPPEYRWQRGTFVTAGADLGSPRYSSSWVFVSEGDFARGPVRGHRVSPSRNAELLAASARVTNYEFENGRIVNRSIDADRISERTKLRIDPVRVGVAATISERAHMRAGGVVPIYKPRIAAKAKTDVNSTLDTSVPVDVNVHTPDVRLPSDDSVNVRAPSVDNPISSDVDAGASARGLIGSSPLSGTNGLGIGGGLRLGR